MFRKNLPALDTTEHAKSAARRMSPDEKRIAKDNALRQEHANREEAKRNRQAARMGRRIVRDAVGNFNKGGELSARVAVDDSIKGWAHYNAAYGFYAHGPLDKKELLPALNRGLEGDEGSTYRIVDVDTHYMHDPKSLRQKIEHSLFQRHIFEFIVEPVTSEERASLPQLSAGRPSELSAGAQAALPAAAEIVLPVLPVAELPKYAE